MRYALVALPRRSDTDFSYGDKSLRFLRHPVYACLGLRPALAQHTAQEHELLKRWAAGRSRIVEIGVAEGISALAMREVMAERGEIYLVDPYHLSRIPALNFTKRAAHRALNGSHRGIAVWIEEFSSDAVKSWTSQIDLLMIDGDHSENAVQRDWVEWSPFVVPKGIVIFHDARLFDGGWTTPEYGPVRLVDRIFRNSDCRGWEIVDEVHSTVVLQRD